MDPSQLGPLLQALQGVVAQLTALLAQMQGGAGPVGGGPGGPPMKMGGGPTDTAVAGASTLPAAGAQPALGAQPAGGGATAVASATGGGAPMKLANPVPAPMKMGCGIPTQVGGVSQVPPMKFGAVSQVPPMKLGVPTQVSAGGFPGQVAPQKFGSPIQNVIQFDGDTAGGGPIGAATLTTNDSRQSAKLTAAGGSVEMWGDPHVEVDLDGQPHQSFTIGYGPASIQLNDGTQIQWDTGDGLHTMKSFQIVRPDGTGQSVDLTDGKNQTSLATGLSSAQLQEFALKLRAHEGGPWTPWVQAA
jgi:hypothetical protein